jgi:hypothetical protein
MINLQKGGDINGLPKKNLIKVNRNLYNKEIEIEIFKNISINITKILFIYFPSVIINNINPNEKDKKIEIINKNEKEKDKKIEIINKYLYELKKNYDTKKLKKILNEEKLNKLNIERLNLISLNLKNISNTKNIINKIIKKYTKLKEIVSKKKEKYSNEILIEKGLKIIEEEKYKKINSEIKKLEELKKNNDESKNLKYIIEILLESKKINKPIYLNYKILKDIVLKIFLLDNYNNYGIRNKNRNSNTFYKTNYINIFYNILNNLSMNKKTLNNRNIINKKVNLNEIDDTLFKEIKELIDESIKDNTYNNYLDFYLSHFVKDNDILQ